MTSATAALQHERRRLTWFAGIVALLSARIADTVTTVPVLVVAPAAELNPVVRTIVSNAGVSGYVLVSILAVPTVLVTVEVLLRVDRWLRGRPWCPIWLRGELVSDNVARVLAYAPVIVVSLLAAVSNAHQLANAFVRLGVVG